MSTTGASESAHEPSVFYGLLASWWPLISPVEEYEEEGEYVASLLCEALRDDAGPGRRTLLDLGSGGGHLASWLANDFDLTLVDLSDAMLDVSRPLHPTAPHVRADMRTVRLDRMFDAVVLHDAVEYMTTEDDVRAALLTARIHVRPGGTVIVIPDATAEIFEPSDGVGGSDGPDGRAVRLLEWTTDLDPSDTVVTTDYVIVLHHADGRSEVFHEVHETGLFSRATWLRLLAEVGLDARIVTEVTEEDRTPREVFVATRPIAPGLGSGT